MSGDSVAPAGEDYGAPHDDPCDCDDCREAVAAQGEHDPRIVHVASELDVDLGPQAENEGNVEFVTDVIAAVDYANEQCGLTYEQGRADERDLLLSKPRMELSFVYGYETGRSDGLGAAMEVVAALWEPNPNVPMPVTYLAGLQAARAAIDALKGDTDE